MLFGYKWLYPIICEDRDLNSFNQTRKYISYIFFSAGNGRLGMEVRGEENDSLTINSK